MAHELVGQRVRVHLNLHRGDFSVCQGGRVVASVDSITITGVTFKVTESMRQKCVELGRRKVHAFAWGTVESIGEPAPADSTRRVSYSPYRGPSFTADGEPVSELPRVTFSDRAGWAV